MSRHLRPTRPQPRTPCDVIYLEPDTLDRALAIAGPCGAGLYAVVVRAAQHTAPCTGRDLGRLWPRDLQLARTLVRLLDAGLVVWVEDEAQNGGAA